MSLFRADVRYVYSPFALKGVLSAIVDTVYGSKFMSHTGARRTS